MTKTEYAEFLGSAYWKQLRADRLQYETNCNRCRIPRWIANLVYDQDLHLHHKTYARVGKELEADLEVLCRRCHEIETFGRTSLRPPRTLRCAICGDLSYDVFPWEIPLCSVCNSLTELPGKFELPHSFDQRPVWEHIFSAIVRHVGLDAALAKLADTEDRWRQNRIRQEQWEKEHPGEVPF